MTGRKLKILLYYIPGSCQIAQSGRIRFVWRKTLVFYMVSAGQEGLCNRERGLLHEPSASIYSTYHSSAAGSTCSSKSLGASAGTTAQGRVLELCNTLTLWTFSFPITLPNATLEASCTVGVRVITRGDWNEKCSIQLVHCKYSDTEILRWTEMQN